MAGRSFILPDAATAGAQAMRVPDRLKQAVPMVLGSVLILAVSVSLALVLAAPASPLASVDRLFESLNFRFFAPARPPSDRVVIVGITEVTLGRLPYRSPLDRGLLARLVETLASQEVRAIGLDVIIDQPTEPEKDLALKRAIDGARVPVILAAISPDTPILAERRRYLDDFLRHQRHGYSNLARESLDSIVRVHIPGNGAGERSFATALAEAAGATPPDHPFRISWRRAAEGSSPFPVYPVHLVPALPTGWLRDKVVLVGGLIPGEDEHRTPISIFSRPTYGVEIHAQALSQMLEGPISDEIGPGLARVMVGSAALLGMALAALGGGVLVVVGLVVLVPLIWSGAVIAFAAGGPLIPPLSATLALGLGAGGVRFWRGRRDARDRHMLMQLFSRFVSEPVVRELWKQRQAFLSGGRPRPQELTATVLFSDIAGFTPICENLAPGPLIAWLDAYIDTMVQVVVAHEGVVLRFIGDGILAVFGAPVPRRSETEISADARNAARCALSMAAAMRRLNDGWRAADLPTAAVRVGIYTGPLVAGSLGSGSHMEYCLLGDTANTAARLEAAGKAHSRGAEDSIILAGEPTMERLGELFPAQSVGELNLRGKERPVRVYRLLADG
jgi:adenylate cyclase